MDVDGSNVTQVSDPAGHASNHIWSPDDGLIAYQSDLDGDIDIYVYQFPTGDEEEGQTRLVTDNEIDDYAPTWFCESTQIVFSSDVDNTDENPNNPNLFTTNALPIDADPIIVDEEASRLTTEPDVDYYPQNSPAEENASRQGSLPSPERNR
jgi:Tol biopolymer transport system component